MKKQKTAGLVLLCLFLVLALFWKWNESRLPLHSRLTAVQDETRNLALVQWLKLSPSKKEAVVSDLLKDVKSPAWQTRRYALYALRKSGLHNELIDDAMVAGLSDSELAVRQEAVVSLLEVGESALPKIFAVLTLNNPDAVSSAFEVIERTNENSLPGLMGLLKNSSAPEGQKNAAILIRKLGPLAKAAGPDLTALLKSPRPDIRQEAALALIAIPYEPEKAAPVLAQGLTEPLSYDLIQSLAQMGSAAKSAVPTLQKILKNGKDGYLSKPYPKPAVAEALSKIDPRRSTWIDIQFDLKQKDPIVRYRAAYVMSQSKDIDVGAIPFLVKMLGDSDPYVLGRIVCTLIRLDFKNLEPMSSSVFPKIIQTWSIIQDPQEVEGYTALLAPELAKQGPVILPPLMTAVKNNTIPLESAYAVISKMDSRSTPFFQGCLKDKNVSIKSLAAFHLHAVAPASEGLNRIINDAAASSNQSLRKIAQKILEGKITQEEKAPVSH